MKVGINGMGRIGRLALRAAMCAADRQADDPYADNRLEIIHLNEHKGGAAATAHLLEFDSVQGRCRAGIAAVGESCIEIAVIVSLFRAIAKRSIFPGASLVWTWCLSAPASCSPPTHYRAILTVVPSG